MKTNYQKVLDFNTCFNHKVSENSYKNVFDEDKKLVELRLSLIKEEINELIEAYKNNDVVEIIDALSDILYVAYGLCVCFGINIDEKYTEYIKKNLGYLKLDFDNDDLKSKTNFNKSQKIIALYSDINDYLDNIKNFMFKSNLETINKSLQDSYTDLETSCNKKDFDDVILNIYKVIKYTYLFGIHIGIDLDKSFEIVHNSNMTKICDTEELAIETVQNYKNNDNRYDTPNYKKNNFGYVIYNESTGKILKSIKYTPANFDSLLN